MVKYIKQALILLVLVNIYPDSSLPWDGTTHAIMNEYASKHVKIGPLSAIVDDKTILEWICQGGVDEDSPMKRSCNHFHNPLRSWDGGRAKAI